MDTRQKILFDLDKTYDKIIDQQFHMADDALELLDMYVFEAGLSKYDPILIEALIDNDDPKEIPDNVLNELLLTYEAALDTLKCG